MHSAMILHVLLEPYHTASAVGRQAQGHAGEQFTCGLPDLQATVYSSFPPCSALVKCISGQNKEEYRGLGEDSVGWCKRNNLQLNLSKMKELNVDFCLLTYSGVVCLGALSFDSNYCREDSYSTQ